MKAALTALVMKVKAMQRNEQLSGRGWRPARSRCTPVFAFVLMAALGSMQQAQAVTQGCSETMARTAGQGSNNSPSALGYQLGPRDSLAIRVLDEDEIGDKPYAIDLGGNIALPRIGVVHVAGLTVDQVQAGLTQCFRELLKEPVVTVSVAQFESQPVTVLGAVANPGIHQIEGKKTLFEVISEAGGLKQDAGNTISITRELQYGPIPLTSAHSDPSGKFSVAEVSVRSIVRAEDPGENIAVRPHDVITVPQAEMVYVVGAVNRAGGFVLTERSQMSVLEALSLAEGLTRTAAGKRAMIMRADEHSEHRAEIPIDVNKVLKGKGPDVSLKSNDILFIPNSTGKSASLSALQTIVGTASGMAIYHPY